MSVRLVLGVVRVFTLLCWTGAPADRSRLWRCVSVPIPQTPFCPQKQPSHRPPLLRLGATKTSSFPLGTATSRAWSQSWSGSNSVQQAYKMQQLILTWLKSQLGSFWLLFLSVCLQWQSLTASQRCNFLHIPLDLLLYYCLQNTESRFCIRGKSCRELSPLWPPLLQISHFSVLLLIVQLCNFLK